MSQSLDLGGIMTFFTAMPICGKHKYPPIRAEPVEMRDRRFYMSKQNYNRKEPDKSGNRYNYGIFYFSN